MNQRDYSQYFSKSKRWLFYYSEQMLRVVLLTNKFLGIYIPYYSFYWFSWWTLAKYIYVTNLEQLISALMNDSLFVLESETKTIIYKILSYVTRKTVNRNGGE